jgi:hypothetical protein
LGILRATAPPGPRRRSRPATRPDGAPDAGEAAELREHVLALDFVLRYPQTWAAFQGRYLRALHSALAPLKRAGGVPDGPVDWQTMHRSGRLREQGSLAVGASGSPPAAGGGQFALPYVCVSATVRLRRVTRRTG